MAADPLLKTLAALGALDAPTLGWARAHLSQGDVPLDTVLLRLDLVGEEQLLQGLADCHDMPAASRHDLLLADRAVAEAISLEQAKALGLAPLHREGTTLVAMMAHPLDDATEEATLQQVGLDLEALIAPHHYLELARAEVYGTTLAPQTAKLEERLRRRRKVGPLRGVLLRLERAESLYDAVYELLRASGVLLDFCAFFVNDRGRMRIAAYSGEVPELTEIIPVPAPGSALAAAVAHQGYYFGPLTGNEAERAFYASLGRTVPAWAYVAPVPAAPGVSFYGDNGDRAIPQRWVAELTLLVARMGQHRGDWSVPFPDHHIRRVSAPPPRLALPRTTIPPAPSTHATDEERALSLPGVVDARQLEEPGPDGQTPEERQSTEPSEWEAEHEVDRSSASDEIAWPAQSDTQASTEIDTTTDEQPTSLSSRLHGDATVQTRLASADVPDHDLAGTLLAATKASSAQDHPATTESLLLTRTRAESAQAQAESAQAQAEPPATQTEKAPSQPETAQAHADPPPTRAETGPSQPEPPAAAPSPAQAPVDPIHASPLAGLTKGEARAIAKLRVAAEDAGLSVEAFVDRFLAMHSPAAPTAQAAEPPALAGEIKGLFEKLAADIPAHFAKGMESAFRDLVPRVSNTPAAGTPAVAPTEPEETEDLPPIVMAAAPAQRKVGNYRAKRRKALVEKP